LARNAIVGRPPFVSHGAHTSYRPELFVLAGALNLHRRVALLHCVVHRPAKENNVNTVRSMTAMLIASGLVFSACGDDDDSQETLAPIATGPTTSETAATFKSTVASFNDADVDFARGMIVHHQQAVEMAELALEASAGASPEVLDLAARIQAAQGPEIEMMTGWLTAWGQPVTMETSGEHDMSSMEGMMTAQEMVQLTTMSGPAFDAMWMEMMVRHHQGAIAQAHTVKAMGTNPDVLTLADQIITSQTEEISEMQSLLAG
jgi:uncharacterized protein (DUF305 family)